MKKRILLGAAIIGTALALAGCDERTSTADKKQAAQTQALAAAAADSVGMPTISRFTERRRVKELYEARDDADLLTFTYLVDLDSRLHCLGRSVGYGIPASVQFTNGEYIAYTAHNTGVATLPQPEPNGLFMPEGLSATWVMMIYDDGAIEAEYIEPTIIVSVREKTGPIVETPCDAGASEITKTTEG